MRRNACPAIALCLSLSVAACAAAPSASSSSDGLPSLKPAENDWPCWRGWNQNNVAPSNQRPPLKWSATENVVWKAEVPGRGHASPCLWGDRIFLPTADDQVQVQSVLCFDRASGRKLWQTEVHRGGFMKSNRKNSRASSTPACDGTLVFVPFMVQGGIWLTALDFNGKIVWQKKLTDYESIHGYAASPALYKSLVIVPSDSIGESYLVAVHRRTGEIVWKVSRPVYKLGTFASPVVGRVASRDQLLLHGPFKVFSYDPNTGQVLWTCDGPADSASSTMCFDANLAFSCAGYPQKNFLAIRADGSGDVTRTHVAWSKQNKMAYVPTPLVADGLLYMVEDSGRAVCYEAATGDVVWENRLRGPFSSSPTLAGGYLYIANEAGVTYVLKAGRKFDLVAQNDLADGVFATPVILRGRIYLRSFHNLYCLGEPYE